MKTKRIVAALLALALCLGLIGCSANKLPEAFDADKVTARADEIVGYANSGDYETIIS